MGSGAVPDQARAAALSSANAARDARAEARALHVPKGKGRALRCARHVRRKDTLPRTAAQVRAAREGFLVSFEAWAGKQGGILRARAAQARAKLLDGFAAWVQGLPSSKYLRAGGILKARAGMAAARQRRAQEISVTVQFLFYRAGLGEARTKDAAKRRGAGDIHHVLDENGFVLQVKREVLLTTALGVLEDSLGGALVEEGRRHAPAHWRHELLRSDDIQHRMEFSPPDFVQFEDVQVLEHSEPFERGAVLNTDDKLYVFHPHSKAELKPGPLAFSSPLGDAYDDARRIAPSMGRTAPRVLQWAGDEHQPGPAHMPVEPEGPRGGQRTLAVTAGGLEMPPLQPLACGPNLFLKLYGEQLQQWRAGKHSREWGRRRFLDVPPSYPGLHAIARPGRPFDPHNHAWTLGEFSSVAGKLGVGLTFLDAQGRELKEWALARPASRGAKLTPSHIYVTHTNGHFYYLGDSRDKSLSHHAFLAASTVCGAWTHGLEAAGPEELAPPSAHFRFGGPPDERTWLPDINALSSLGLPGGTLRVVIPASMEHAFFELLRAGYQAHVRFAGGRFCSLTLNLCGTVVVLSPPDAPDNEAAPLIASEGEFKLYCAHNHAVRSALMRHDLFSHYSQGLVGLWGFMRAPMVGGVDHEGPVIEEDMSKAYTSIVNSLDCVGVFEVFDVPSTFDGCIRDAGVYLVHYAADLPPVGSFDCRSVLLQAGLNLVDGALLRICVAWRGITVLQQCLPSRTASLAPVRAALQALWASDLPVHHKKDIPNKAIGMTGKRCNRSSVTTVFQSRSEAQHYLELARHCADAKAQLLKRVSGGLTVYLLTVSRQSTLVDGFLAIQSAVYCRMKALAYLKCLEARDAGREVKGVNVDAVCAMPPAGFLPLTAPQQRALAAGALVLEPKQHSYKGLGTWSQTLKNGIAFRKPAVREEMEPPALPLPLVPILLEVPNEMEPSAIFPQLDACQRVLIRASTAGAGKTSLVVAYSAHLAARGLALLCIVPNNLQAYDLRQRGVEAVTWHRLTGVRPTEEGEETSAPLDVAKYDVAFFDEIFYYSTRQHARIMEFMGAHPNKRFIAAGDTFQLLHRDTAGLCVPARPYMTQYIEQLFPAHIFLRTNKRMQTLEDKQRAEEFRLDCFGSPTHPCLPRTAIACKYFTPITRVEDVQGKAICFTNRDRGVVNNVLHERAVRERKARDEPVHEHPKASPLYVGQVMRCLRQFGPRSNPFHTNYLYRVEAIGNGVELWDFNAEQESNASRSELKKATFAQLNSNFCPNYALTGHSAQGLTFEGAVTIFGHCHFHASPEWLYVAGTRARSFKDVYFFAGTPMDTTQSLVRLRSAIEAKIRGCLAADARAGRGFAKEAAIAVDDVLALLCTVNGSDVQWHDSCPACSCTLQLHYEPGDLQQFSIDRLNNSLAHTKGNVRITCLRCNTTEGARAPCTMVRKSGVGGHAPSIPALPSRMLVGEGLRRMLEDEN